MSSDQRYAAGAAEESSGESVLTRAVTLLNAFDARHVTLSLSALVSRSGLPKTTVHRMAHELTRLGLLARENGRYSVGERVLKFASLAPARRTLREAALPYMQDLYEATHGTIQLGIASGTEVLYVEKIHGHQKITDLSRVGSRMPLHTTAIGKAIMAYSPPVLLDSVVDAGLEALTSTTITSARLLRHEVQEVTTRGIAYDREESKAGVCCAASPILGASGLALGAISVSGPAARTRWTGSGSPSGPPPSARHVSSAA